jgi:cytochrome c oxidase subunit 3
MGWIFQILKEGFKGEHTKYVMNGLKLGFLLFISSEVMLFFAVF